jgi:ferredoxin-type protein NapH
MANRQKLRQGIILFSFFLFPATFYYLSPVLILESASYGIVNGSFIVFGLLFLSSIVLGRGWCGWLCPAAGCQEALFRARNKKVSIGNWIKWMIWFPWIGSIAMLATKAGGYSDVDPFYKTVYGFSITDFPSCIAYFGVLFILIVLPSLIFGRRAFCHHLCWMAPFMIIGRKIANKARVTSLKLSIESEKCVHCQRCTEHCPMSLQVETMVESRKMEHPECILCGTCADICKEKTISLGFK